MTAVSPLLWGETLSAPPVASRRLDGATPVLMRRWRGVRPNIEQPALDHHYLTLHLGGPKRIRRNGEGREARGEIAEGAYSLTPAGAAFSWRTEGPVDFAHLYLRPAAVDHVVVAEFDREPRAVSLIEALGARDPLLEALLAELEAGLTEDGADQRLYWDGLLHTLIHRLISRHSTAPATTARASLGLAPFRVNRVLEFVEANLAADIGLAELARVAGVSAYHFTRGFRRATGRAPYADLIHRRIEHAKVLLAGGDMPLVEVASACGLGSGRLSTLFKRATGLPPGRWRRRREI